MLIRHGAQESAVFNHTHSSRCTPLRQKTHMHHSHSHNWQQQPEARLHDEQDGARRERPVGGEEGQVAAERREVRERVSSDVRLVGSCEALVACMHSRHPQHHTLPPRMPASCTPCRLQGICPLLTPAAPRCAAGRRRRACRSVWQQAALQTSHRPSGGTRMLTGVAAAAIEARNVARRP